MTCHSILGLQHSLNLDIGKHYYLPVLLASTTKVVEIHWVFQHIELFVEQVDRGEAVVRTGGVKCDEL